mmetsp:Transcript_60584/g.126840  ORF Transcript_60584/g.126840 Transcript_60584/m.126840 type:complete len:145 (-) Transcript_60584:144-578(-)
MVFFSSSNGLVQTQDHHHRFSLAQLHTARHCFLSVMNGASSSVEPQDPGLFYHPAVPPIFYVPFLEVTEASNVIRGMYNAVHFFCGHIITILGVFERKDSSALVQKSQAEDLQILYVNLVLWWIASTKQKIPIDKQQNSSNTFI